MESAKIHDLDFFAYLDVFFTDSAMYAKCSDALIHSHFFKLQRTIAKMLPVQAQALNIEGLNSIAASKFMHAKLCKNGGHKPQWTYTKSEQPLAKDTENSFNQDELMLFATAADIEYKSALSYATKHPQQTKRIITALKKTIKGKVSSFANT